MNHIFKTFDELYDWVQTKQTKSNLFQDITALIEKEIARRLGQAAVETPTVVDLSDAVVEQSAVVEQPAVAKQPAVIEQSVLLSSKLKTTFIPLYYDRLPVLNSSVLRSNYSGVPAPEFNNTFFSEIDIEEEPYDCFDVNKQSSKIIRDYFNNQMCTVRSLEYNATNLYTDNEINKYCIYLWMEFYYQFGGTSIPSNVIEAINVFMKTFSPDKIDTYQLYICPNSVPVNHKFYIDLHKVYDALSNIAIAIRHNILIARLAYELVRNEYLFVYNELEPTREELQTQLKKWIMFYIMDCVRESEMQSSALLFDITTALGRIGTACDNNYYCSKLQGLLNSKVLAQVLSESGITSTRKSAGIFYDLSKFMKPISEVEAFNKCDTNFTFTDYAAAL